MKIKEINKYSEKIVETMAEGLIVVSPEGKVLAINESFEKMTGFQADDIIGESCTMLDCTVCPKNTENNRGSWCTLFEMEKIERKRCSLKKKDGSHISVMKNATIIRDSEGQPTAALEVITDITEFDLLDQRVDLLSKKLSEDGEFFDIIGKSESIKKVFDLMSKAAQSDAPIIILGESGTGKELIAQAIHKLGRRKEKPYVQLNCAALNESLLESELFGHVKGAFTGAIRTRIGRFEAAKGGDIFLDEIGDAPLSTQLKLLRVLEENKMERVGDHESIDVDVRLITATNKNLKTQIENGVFREDFFYRINVIPIEIPPLRERKEDIPLLVNYFIKRLKSRTGKNINGLHPSVLNFFMQYAWPGNIRELKNALEYAFVLTEKGLIEMNHLPKFEDAPVIPNSYERIVVNSDDPPKKVELILALQQANGNQSQAAKLLGVNRGTIWNRMKKYGIDMERLIRS